MKIPHVLSKTVTCLGLAVIWVQSKALNSLIPVMPPAPRQPPHSRHYPLVTERVLSHRAASPLCRALNTLSGDAALPLLRLLVLISLRRLPSVGMGCRVIWGLASLANLRRFRQQQWPRGLWECLPGWDWKGKCALVDMAGGGVCHHADCGGVCGAPGGGRSLEAQGSSRGNTVTPREAGSAAWGSLVSFP